MVIFFIINYEEKIDIANKKWPKTTTTQLVFVYAWFLAGELNMAAGEEPRTMELGKFVL